VLERVDMFVLSMVVGLEALVLLAAVFRDQVVARTEVALLIKLPLLVAFFLWKRLAFKHQEVEKDIAKRKKYWTVSVIAALSGSVLNAIFIVCFHLSAPDMDATMLIMPIGALLAILGSIGFLSSCLFHEGITFWTTALHLAIAVLVFTPLLTFLFLAPAALIARVFFGIVFDYESKEHTVLFVSSGFFALCCSISCFRSRYIQNARED